MIAIIITTFLRDELLFKCLDSIDKYWDNKYYVIVVDQGKQTFSKDQYWKYRKNIIGEYIKTDYDIGPLKARNIAIKRAKELYIPYIIMSADSILFNTNYDFDTTIDFLNQENNRFLCSFDIKDRIPWECDMVKTDRFELDIPRRNLIIYNNSFQTIDLARNFFICKTDMLNESLYDEDRLMCDHESSFWRWKEKGYKCFYNKDIQADYILDRPKDYLLMRNRLNQCKIQMMKKYNLKGWVKYSPELTKFWSDWKNEKSI